MTGRRYHISIAPLDATATVNDFGPVATFGSYPAAAGCPYAWDFVDCGQVTNPSSPRDAASQYCQPDPTP